MAQAFARLAQIGMGFAAAGTIVNSALFNGEYSLFCFCHQCPLSSDMEHSNILCFCYVAVDGGFRAVIFDRFKGVKQDVIGEGTHFYIPWVQRPILFDIRSRARNVPVVTGSKGMVKWSLLILYLLTPEMGLHPTYFLISF